jgi:VWFA-related protein
MKAWIFAAACVALARSLAAQDQASQAPPAFTAGVELVRLDVRVTDAQGHPVRDLRQDEVEILENGARRPVVFFQHIEEPAGSYADVASQTVAGEVSTNQGAARGHLYVLVFDQLHITPGNEQRARLAAQQFVQTRLRPGDRVALYALPGPGPQIGFTPDARRISAELARVHGLAQPQAFGALGSMTIQEAFQIVRGHEQTLQSVADRLQSQSAPTDARRADSLSFGSSSTPLVRLVREDARRIADLADGDTRRVLAALSDVLRPFRGIEGRKSVLLVSEGFYGDRLAHEIQEVAAAAAESYSVVHAFDVNRRGVDITADQASDSDPAIGIQDRISPLGSLAAETGGTLILDASQYPDRALASLADQSQDYYLVGFTPAGDARKGREAYRPVTVRVARGGARVSARTGFVLTDNAVRMDRHRAIERALSAPFSQQGLPVRYTTYVLRGSASGLQRVIVSLATELPIGSPDRDQAADVVFVVRAATDGHVAASGRDTIVLPQRRALNATTGTGTYRVQFEAPAGDYLMRVAVREPGGLVGTADRRFTVRALDGPGLTSGDLVLSSARSELPVRPTAYTEDGLSGVLELYGRTASQLRDAHVAFDLVPIGESTPARSGSAELQEIDTSSTGVARGARVELPLQGVVSGTYVARARVMLGPDTVTEVVREVEVRQGQRPASADDDPAPFDPRDIVNGSFARQYAAALGQNVSPAATKAQRGLERLAARDYPAAISAFEAALGAGQPDAAAASAAFFLGWAFHAAGDDRQAISAWRRAAYLDPTTVPAHLALADMYERLSQPALAVQAIRAGLAALPKSPELLDRLSRLERP